MDERRLRDLYDRQAGEFDASMARLERIAFRGDREWLGTRARGDTLELAVGTGRNLAHYPPGSSLIGVDLSAGMLRQAALRAARMGLPIDLRVGDAQALDLPDASCDTVTISFSLCCVPDPQRALQEAHRVLRPGGRLVMVEHVLSTHPLVGLLQRCLEPIWLRRAGEHLTRELEPLVAATGLVVTEAHRHTAGSVLRLQALRGG